nr:MAG TPA: endonuclease-like protein [Caudoviricetes sp.]
MLIPGQYAKMRWHPRNKYYYMERGYAFTKMGDEFDVKVEDLPSESHTYVKVQCDFCGEIIDVKYQNYNHRGLKSGGYACTKCKYKKIHNVMQEVYGVDTPSQIDGFYEKAKATCQEKYGVDHYASTQECRDKVMATCMKRYGPTNYLTSEEGKKKVVESNLKKFGTPHLFGNKEITRKLIETQTEKYGGVGMASPYIRKKIEHTLLDKYGTVKLAYIPEFNEKRRMTLYKNGTAPSSKPQILLNDKLKEIYGNAELNYPCGNLSLDSMIIVGEYKIDVEYDCWYWHKNKKKQDYQRDWVVKQAGYKVLRVKGYTKIPSDEQIKEAIDYLVKDNHEFSRIIVEPEKKI